MRLIFIFLLSFAAAILNTAPAGAVDKDCNYTPGSTSVNTGFANCDQELVELYKRAPATATGVSGTNDISLTFDPVVGPTPVSGQAIIFTAVATSTGTVRIIFDGGSPINAANEQGSNLGTGDIQNTQTYMGVYDGTKVRIIVRGSGGGGGAPTTADYVTLSANGTLTAERALTAGTAIGLTDGGANSTITVAVNDVELTSIAGLVSAADKLPYYTGSGTASLADFTATGRSIVDDASVAAVWATITGDEFSQDAVGTILTDGTFLDFTYNDATPSITATIIANSLTAAEIAANAIGSSELADTSVDTAALQDDAVSFAKFQNIATDRLVGRDTAATGDAEEISLNATLEFTGAGAIQRAALTGDVTASAGSNATTVAGDAVALTTDTTGNYVGTVAASTGIAVTGADAENATKTIAFSYSDQGSSPALNADECVFTSNATTAGYIVCEGDTADGFETRIAVTDPATSDRVFTIPNADSNPIQPLSCSGTDKVSAISSTGVITCTADAGGAGSGDNVTVEDGDNGGTFTAATDAEFEDSGDINFVLDTATTPDQISALVRANSVALTTDTTGNYIDDVLAGVGIAVTHTPAEGSDATVAFTFADAGADPALGAAGATFSSEGASAAGLVFEGDTNDTIETRLRVTDPTGSDRIATIPNADSAMGQAITCSGTDKTSAFSATTGAFTCSTDDDVPESGDFTNLTGGSGIDNNSGTLDLDLTEITTATWGNANFTDMIFSGAGAIDLTLNWATSNQMIVTQTDAGAAGPIFNPYHNSASPAASDVIYEERLDGEDSAGNTQTYARERTTINDATSTSEDGTWSVGVVTAGTVADELNVTGAAAAPTADKGLDLGTSDTLRFGTLFLGTGADLDDTAELRFYEAEANGDNKLIFKAPATITSDSTCTLENDGNPIPDSCVGDGVDAGAGGGDSISVNGTAATDGDFDDATPAAPAGGYNVKWQKDAGTPNNISAYVDITGATDLTAPAVADSLLVNDDSASDATREVLLSDFLKIIDGLTEDTAPNHADDFLAFYDTSAATVDKVNPEKIGIGKEPIALLAGAGTLPSGGAIAACTSVTAFDSGTNDVFLKQCSFSAATDNAIYWTIPAPKASDETIDWTLRIDWTSATTTDGSDDVIWTAAAVCFSNDDPINGNAFPAVDTVTDTQTAAGDFLSSSEITAITPAGTWAENDMCVLRVTRDADAAGDNFNGTAELINAQLYITTNVNTDN